MKRYRVTLVYETDAHEEDIRNYFDTSVEFQGMDPNDPPNDGNLVSMDVAQIPRPKRRKGARR